MGNLPSKFKLRMPGSSQAEDSAPPEIAPQMFLMKDARLIQFKGCLRGRAEHERDPLALDAARAWRPQRQLERREDWEGLSLYAMVADRHKFFFPWGPRKSHEDFAWDECVRRSLHTWERQEVEQLKARTEVLARSLAFHANFRVGHPRPFELPDVAPSVPLSTVLGDRIITIVTTACLPWLTGTSINPLLRAAYIERRHGGRVILLVPWLPPKQQRLVYPNDLVFETEEQHAAYVKSWVRERLGGAPLSFRVHFYPAEYDPRKKSIFPIVGDDMTELIPDEEADVAVLEEPEHLCWYHFSHRWRNKFKLVIGVAHTNYIEYIRREPTYRLFARPIKYYNMAVVRANCHRVIRLSGGVQEFCQSVISNVHGVSPQFLRRSGAAWQSPSKGRNGTHKRGRNGNVGGKGDASAAQWDALEGPEDMDEGAVLSFSRGCYFVGKVVWSKGYRELCDLLKHHCEKHGFPRQARAQTGAVTNGGAAKEGLKNGASSPSGNRLDDVWVDIYGSGFEEDEIKAFAKQERLPVTFWGRRDHADESLLSYKVFVNPSVSDVLCTTTAEALAMGKFVVLADHPSNEFFKTCFPENCITYNPKDPDDFSAALLEALEGQPAPLSREQRYLLTWEAATERFMEASGLWPVCADGAHKGWPVRPHHMLQEVVSAFASKWPLRRLSNGAPAARLTNGSAVEGA